MKISLNIFNSKLNLIKKNEQNVLQSLFNKKIKSFPKDLNYLKLLGENIGLKTGELYKLYSIIGPEQLKSILSSAERKNFYAGKNIPHGDISENISEIRIPEDYRLNLHTHTTKSDGKMSVESLLNQSALFADTKSSTAEMPKFVVAITDHDTFEGSKEAVKLIAQNPEKYKNLGVVLGAELSAIYRDAGKLNKPFEYEMVAYSINPFDEEFSAYLKDTIEQRIQISKKIISDAQKHYPKYNFSYEEACKHTINAKKGINGFLYTISNYFRDKISSIGGKDDITYLCDRYQPANYTKRPLLFNEAEDIFSYIKDKFGFLGIAHPGKIGLGDGRIKDSFIKSCEKDNKNAGIVIMQSFIKALKKSGKNKFKAIETNYQNYKGDLKEANYIINGQKEEKDKNIRESIEWLQNFRELAKKYRLLETGGLDTHQENPFMKG